MHKKSINECIFSVCPDFFDLSFLSLPLLIPTSPWRPETSRAKGRELVALDPGAGTRAAAPAQCEDLATQPAAVTLLTELKYG